MTLLSDHGELVLKEPQVTTVSCSVLPQTQIGRLNLGHIMSPFICLL